MKNRNINVLIAPNSMKGSLNAFEFAEVVEEAFRKVSKRYSITKLPVADGGDYTGEVLRKNLQAHLVKLEVTDPLGRQISSGYGVAGETAIIEMADASGVRLLAKGELNPLKTSSLGTGTLINDAIRNGCKEILLGVGGSATIDGGAGMLTALGFRLFDENGSLLEGNGGNLSRINRVQQPTLPKNVSMKIICDVENPLLGTQGAVKVFGAQKGATPQMKTLLENGLANWCQILEHDSGKRLGSLNGAGAARRFCTPGYAKALETYSPFRFSFLDHVKRRLRRQRKRLLPMIRAHVGSAEAG